MTKPLSITLAAALAAVTIALPVVAAEDGYEEGGKYFTKDDVPTYNVAKDGTVDWYTYSGFRRYHSECHVCHGPDGLGSSFAPALTKTLKSMSYDEFLGIVASGRENVSTQSQNQMPAFGTNPNVMCYIDDIYVYLKARSDEAVPRGRPSKKQKKPDRAKEAEDACMG